MADVQVGEPDSEIVELETRLRAAQLDADRRVVGGHVGPVAAAQ